MFGYVKILKPELKIKEYEAYKGIYCTLCKEMGKEYGAFSRFLLSYDGAFCVLYKISLNNYKTEIEKSRCTFNPLKKCMKISCETDIYKFASAVTVILAYFKLIDNIKDSSFLKKMMLYTVYPYFALLKNKAKKKYNDVYEKIKDIMNEQFCIESGKDISIDRSADPTAKMLAWLLSYGECGENAEKSYNYGYQLGRVVYFLDAFDDYEKDLKNNSFNPFKNTDNIVDEATFAINLSIGELLKISKTLKLYQFEPIEKNIVFDGLNFQLTRITQKYRGAENE